MSVQLYDPFSAAAPAPQLGFDGTVPAQYGAPQSRVFQTGRTDTISRMMPQANGLGLFGGSGGCGGLMRMLQSLLQQLSQLLGGLGNGGRQNGESYFQNAQGSSVGDPHLAFNGQKWDNMQSQRDLLHSTSVPGGYRVSTQTTQPNAQGVTWNQSATVFTNGGANSVRLDNNGNATYDRYGVVTSIAPGQTIDGPNGETISRDQDGSVNVTARTPEGGHITTTLRNDAQGVDVNVQSSNVLLGGALVDHNEDNPLPPLYPF